MEFFDIILAEKLSGGAGGDLIWVVPEQTVTIEQGAHASTENLYVDTSKVKTDDFILTKGVSNGQTAYVNCLFKDTYFAGTVGDFTFDIFFQNATQSWKLDVTYNGQRIAGTYTVSAIKGF